MGSVAGNVPIIIDVGIQMLCLLLVLTFFMDPHFSTQPASSSSTTTHPATSISTAQRHFVHPLTTTRFGVLDGTTLANRHLAGRIRCTGRRTDAILDLGGHRHEGLLHIGGILCGRLEERNAQLVGVLLCSAKPKQKNVLIPSHK